MNANRKADTEKRDALSTKRRKVDDLATATRLLTQLPTLKNDDERVRRVLVGTPSLGTVRMEWHNAVTGLVIPCNWSNSASTPLGFLVDDAQNLLVQQCLRDGFTWLMLLEDDVVPPPDLFLKFARYLDDPDVREPIVSGLYHLKGSNRQPEPLIYRGRGNGAFRGFIPGEVVRVDGIPTGCCIIHRRILEVLSSTAPSYELRANGTRVTLPRVFVTPRAAFADAGTGSYQKLIGTSDLNFCDQIIRDKVLATAGWPQLQRLRYPFLCDTSILCGHIDRTTGVVY